MYTILSKPNHEVCNYVGMAVKLRSGHEKILALLSKTKTDS